MDKIRYLWLSLRAKITYKPSMVGPASAANGRLGGRPRGTTKTNAEKYAAKKLRPTLMERCQQNELRHVETLERIADDEKEPTGSRVTAISMLLDRARGKPNAHTDIKASGEIVMTVVTGVPEPDGPDWRTVGVVEHDELVPIPMVTRHSQNVAESPPQVKIPHEIEAPKPRLPEHAKPAPPKSYTWHRGG